MDGMFHRPILQAEADMSPIARFDHEIELPIARQEHLLDADPLDRESVDRQFGNGSEIVDAECDLASRPAQTRSIAILDLDLVAEQHAIVVAEGALVADDRLVDATQLQRAAT